jgi:hypothetical protein
MTLINVYEAMYLPRNERKGLRRFIIVSPTYSP